MSIRSAPALTVLLTAAALAACSELPGSRYQTDDDAGTPWDGSAGDGADGALSDGYSCPPRDALLAHNLRRLNALRRGRWAQQLQPLQPDACLEQIAATALAEWTAGGEPHGTFERECLPRVPECECGWEQENVGWSRGLTWKRSIDVVLAQMMAEEFYDGGHFRNIVSPRWSSVGIAIDCRLDGGTVTIHLVNEFAP